MGKISDFLNTVRPKNEEADIKDKVEKLLAHWKRNPPNAQTGHAKEYHAALKKVNAANPSEKDVSLVKELWSMYGSKLESNEAEELSQEVQDKIKANNDKMTALKAKGGEEAEKEIDDLEKENDELNGGNKTATAESWQSSGVTLDKKTAYDVNTLLRWIATGAKATAVKDLAKELEEKIFTNESREPQDHLDFPDSLEEKMSDADKTKIENLRKELEKLKERDDKLKRDHTMTSKALKSKGVMAADRSPSDTAKWKKDLEDYKKELANNKEKRAKIRDEIKKMKEKK